MWEALVAPRGQFAGFRPQCVDVVDHNFLGGGTETPILKHTACKLLA